MKIKNSDIAVERRSGGNAAIFRVKAKLVVIIILFVGFVLTAISSSFPGPLRDMGLSLITSGVISLVYEISLREEFLKVMKAQLVESLSFEFDVLKRIDNAGIIDVYPDLASANVAAGLSSALKVRIMQTWMPDVLTLLRPLKEACSNGCLVQLLLLDPDSPLAEARSRDLGYQGSDMVPNNIRSNLREIQRFCLQEQIQRNVEIRLHETVPSVSLYSFDDTILVGFYLNRTPAILNPQIEARGNASYFASVVNQHFENIWNAAKRYDLA